jgi:septum site-determining protein MinC
MPVSSTARPSGQVSFEIKSAQLSLVALLVKTTDWDLLAQELNQKYGPLGDSPDFFDNDALVLDFSQLASNKKIDDLAPLLQALRSCRLMPMAVRGANAACTAQALSLGLVEAPAEQVRARPAPASSPTSPTSSSAPPEQVIEVVREVVHEVVHEVVREVAVAGPATLVIHKPLRSGQKIYARGADLVVLAMVNQGAEVVADGNIHVYAPLRGKAMAGASGNTHARIFSLCLEPELISIAGIYRTSENPLPVDVRGKAAQVRLSNDGQDKLLIEALKT